MITDVQRQACKRYREKDPEAYRKYQRNWQRQKAHKHPEEARRKSYAAGIRRRYGLSVDEYEAKLASQNNLCALCNLPFDGEIKYKGGKEGTAPVLDHSHVSGKLRDFVHRSCNLGIGHFKDDPKLCRLAAEYLERHSLEEEA